MRMFYTETYLLDPDFSLRVLIVPIDQSVALKPGLARKSRTSATSIDQLLDQSAKLGSQLQPLKPSPDDRIGGKPTLLIRKRPAPKEDPLRNFPFSGPPAAR